MDYISKIEGHPLKAGALTESPRLLDTTPYLFRRSFSNGYGYETLIGGTCGVNQLVQNGNFADTSGWSFTNGTATASSNVCHFTFNATANRTELYCFIANTNSAHDYLFAYTIKSSKAVSVASVGGAISKTFGSLNANQEYVNMTIVKGGNNTLLDIYTDGSFENGDTIDYKNIVLIDLTTYFGTTIADYANTLESGTAGEGITWLKANGFFGNDYYPYNSGALLSVKTSKKINRDADNNIIGEYPLDDIELRGILKLDGSNNLYYDGDTYESNGSVTRKYEYRAYASGDESLPDTITDGTYTVTKLVTPTFETADTFTNPMIVDGNGTEEFVDGRTVEMPVGHETIYVDNSDKTKLDNLPDISDSGDGTYVVKQENGQMKLTAYSNELPAYPNTDGNYRLNVSISGGVPVLSWELIES